MADCNLVIATEDPGQPELLDLLGASDAYHMALYPAESNHLLDIRDLRRPEIIFLAARVAGKALGIGAIVSQGDYAEIKRMFVAPAARGRGVGRHLLENIEMQAHRLRHPTLRLETGTKQPEALGLYRAAGYREIGPFGAYRPDPYSIFMEKRLPARPS